MLKSPFSMGQHVEVVVEGDDDGSGSRRRLRVHLRLQAEPGLPFGLF